MSASHHEDGQAEGAHPVGDEQGRVRIVARDGLAHGCQNEAEGNHQIEPVRAAHRSRLRAADRVCVILTEDTARMIPVDLRSDETALRGP